ncbi:MAG: hypothetical protein IJ887_06215 [Prevotella sp.]|nr:hypothetical protein [Prevotella sp.]
MKKTLFLFIMMLLPMWASAQTVSLLSDSKEWTMAYLGAVGPEYQHTFSYEQIKLGSAIEMDGMTFKQIVSSSWNYNQNGPSNWKETNEFLGEANGKVYLYNQQSKNTAQIMDFTLKVGDTYRQMLTADPNDGYMDFVVTAVTDTVIATSVDKTPRKCLYLSIPGSTNRVDVWVEGIGSLVGGVRGAYVLQSAGAIPMLRTCKQDGQTLYEAYHPFLKEGKTWNYRESYHNLWDDEQWTKDVSYVINGTTEIDGKTYYKMYRVSEEGSNYYCALREENRKVWMRTDDGDDRLLYDFGMSVGDSYKPYNEWSTFQLVDISPMRFNDELLNVFHYEVTTDYFGNGETVNVYPYSIVEGVGCDMGWNILELFYEVPSNGIIIREDFLSCYEDDKCIFTADDFNDLTNTKPEDDYIPLVKEGKQWHMVVSKGDEVNMLKYMLTNEEVVKDGKTYFKLYSSSGEVVHNEGLLREEDKKVYFYDSDMQEEFLLFDYSLKPGDTFETFSYDDYKKVSYKVLSVGDCLEGPEVIRNDYEDATGSTISDRRYLRKWTVCRTDDEAFQKTWIEGIGSFGGPIDNLYDASPISTAVYLAYVDDSDGGLYLPFSFHDTLWKQASGCDLPTGEEDHSGDDYHHQLRYELEGDRLHVYGEVYTQCGPNNYAYFIISPETLLYEELYGDPSIRKYNFVIQEVQPTMDCMALRSTDFYVSGFDPDLNYIIVDNQGEEHQVINKIAQIAYRPMIEDDKVWKVGAEGSGNPVQWVEYYYFDGDTIIDGRTCKQMMRQRYVSTDFPEYDFYSQQPSLDYVGAWYEEDKRVYEYDTTSQKFKLMYDFSLWTNAYWHFDNKIYMVGPRQTGGVKGFKGVYRDVWKYSNNEFYVRSTPWLEGVGGLLGPTINVIDGELADPMWFLMSCTVGDEVIYLNDEYEDGATPEVLNARKQQIDFTHTIKTRPKAPKRGEAQQSLYGEYNALQLDINLTPLDDAYLVRITDESGNAVYEKNVNAGNIVGLNIDISTYAEGRYTVTVENSEESFTGQFEAQMTRIRLGDVNGDRTVDVADISTVISMIANGVGTADVNGDGVTDVADISAIISIMAGRN